MEIMMSGRTFPIEMVVNVDIIFFRRDRIIRRGRLLRYGLT